MSKDDTKTVTIATSQLKQRLNAVYVHKRVKRNGVLEPVFERFNDLWDLKELALLQHKESVDVPRAWVEDLDASAPRQLGS